MKDSFIYGGTAAIIAGTIISIAFASNAIHSTPAASQDVDVGVSEASVVEIETLPVEPEAEVASEAETEPVSEAVPQSKDFDGSSYSETGPGDFYISSASGSSEDGEDVYFYYNENMLMDSLGFSAWNFDGKMLTYIYVDGIQNRRDQIADTQGTIELSGDLLSKGLHKVEAVQFEDNDPQKTVITYKSAEYEVRSADSTEAVSEASETEDSSDISEPEMTMSQKQALGKAKDYLQFSAFSYKGLIHQLEYEKYDNADATFAAANCGADWNEQAVKKAKQYLEFQNYSLDELVHQLEFEGFTEEQASYGANEAYKEE